MDGSLDEWMAYDLWIYLGFASGFYTVVWMRVLDLVLCWGWCVWTVVVGCVAALCMIGQISETFERRLDVAAVFMWGGWTTLDNLWTRCGRVRTTFGRRLDDVNIIWMTFG